MSDSMDLLNNEPVARKSMVLFYMIDTSGSMRGDKIGTVNTVMEEIIPEIRDIGGSDSDISISVMTFDASVRWMYDAPISIEEFNWSRLSADGWTNFNDALGELNSKLSRNAFMKSASLSFAPVIFLLSDGEPSYPYESNLEKLKNNKWFNSALKVAVAIGSDANKEVLTKFTGNPETVVEANNGKALARLIKTITVTSSQIGSKSSTMDSKGSLTPEEADQAKQNELVEAVKNSVMPEDVDYDDGW